MIIPPHGVEGLGRAKGDGSLPTRIDVNETREHLQNKLLELAEGGEVLKLLVILATWYAVWVALLS
jgi:hypothetical protein